MTFYYSNDNIKNNAQKWAKNISIDSTRRRDISIIVDFSCYTRLPRKKDILARYHTLLDFTKNKKERINVICDELLILWIKLSFPVITKQSIISKLENLIYDNEKNRKREKEAFYVEIENIFDITKEDGHWLCQEDKNLYNLQIATKGKVGYATNKVAPKSLIHPSKRKRSQTPIEEPPSSRIHLDKSSKLIVNDFIETEKNPIKKSLLRSPTSHAVNLVTKHSLSTNKAAVVCSGLAKNGLCIPTPSQLGICILHSANQN